MNGVANHAGLTGLSWNELTIYRALADAAAAGAPCPTADALGALIRCASPSTTPTIVGRLERKGLIRVERYQRSRRVQIVATGDWTAEPPNQSPHWRERPKAGVPAPARTVVAAHQPTMASEIAMWAQKRGVSLADALCDLVFVGWQVEQDRG